MRVMLRVAIDTDRANRMMAEGTLGSTIEEILAGIGPEAVYFHTLGGRRAITLVADVPDGASMPSLNEPFWQHLGATVEVEPVLTADELGVGLSRLG